MITIKNRITLETLLEIETLRGADLRGADFSNADLRDADFSNADKFFSSPWGFCHIQKENIRIGCQYHKTNHWEKFTDEQIAKMDRQARNWWKENKSIVLNIAESCAEIGAKDETNQ